MPLPVRKLALFLLLFAAPVMADETHLPTAPLLFITQEGTVQFTVEEAKTPEQQEHGLMNRTSVPDKQGMIFVFDKPLDVHMWMKDTLVPLDMIFIDANRVVSDIAQNATPESEKTIKTSTPSQAVIEVAGGACAKYHIAKGNSVIYGGFP